MEKNLKNDKPNVLPDRKLKTNRMCEIIRYLNV